MNKPGVDTQHSIALQMETRGCLTFVIALKNKTIKI